MKVQHTKTMGRSRIRTSSKVYSDHRLHYKQKKTEKQNPTLNPKELEKEEKTKPKVSRRSK